MNTNTQQIWFITGAGKGLGAAIAKEALQNGYTVVAAARNPEAAKKNLAKMPICTASGSILWTNSPFKTPFRR